MTESKKVKLESERMSVKKNCDICNRSITEKHYDEVWDMLNGLDIDRFADIMESSGMAAGWQTAVFCINCFDYYNA